MRLRHTVSHRSGVALALAALTAVVFHAQSGTGQPPPTPAQPPDPQQPTFRTATNYVRVDVFPTKDGKPVQGLKAEEFEVFEDGVRQRIEAFEHVLITPAGPQGNRREPSSVPESLQEATNPRARVFVIFLDTPNVSVEGSHQIKEPIIRLIDRILGPDDLAALMTPAMSTSNLTLTRKTVVIEQQLRDNWIWGTRHSPIAAQDEREKAYEDCYPLLPHETGVQSALAQALIARKRERATLEALQDLVRWLHGVREERKAVITVTEGWVRYQEDHALMKLRESGDYQESIPGPEVIGVDRRGKLTTKPTGNFDDVLSKRECDTDRMRLAMMDNEQFFLDIVNEANRGNASFYPIDPRGLAVWDSPLGPEAPPPIPVDQANLRARRESLYDLALGTDGLAVVNSNDLDKGLRRIAGDLTSYYLLGYYSTNAKLDGRFRRLEVKVKRPGVDIRARRGYRAPSVEEVAAARAVAEAPAAVAPSAFAAAMSTLARIRPDARFRINASTYVADGDGTTVWVAGELPRGTGPERAAEGGTVDIEVRAAGISETAKVVLQPGQRGFVTSLKLAASDLDQVDVRARFSGAGSGVPVTDAIVTNARPAAGQPLIFRRGPSTANRVVPAADFRFHRSERIRLELPLSPAARAGTGRLLDRAGKPLQIPVKVGERVDEATGQRWATADIPLAPLAAGDYAVELTTVSGAETSQTMTAFRVSR